MQSFCLSLVNTCYTMTIKSLAFYYYYYYHYYYYYN